MREYNLVLYLFLLYNCDGDSVGQHSLMAETVLGSRVRNSCTKFKVAMLGNSGVGKTSMVQHFTEGDSNCSVVSTLGEDLHTKRVQMDGREVNLQIWDTAGQERFAELSTVYCRGADAVILCYDITNLCSFKDVENWLDTVTVPDEALVVLVGCKSDLNEMRLVASELGRAKAAMLSETGVNFFETSVKSGSGGVDKVFDFISSQLVSSKQSIDKTATIRLDKSLPAQTRKRKCKCSSS